jgi:glycosyltransferase involved in cell wall biosynthesis
MTTPAAATPVVSIVLPTFNRLDLLRPAVESVFAQTFADWQLVIADDGSDSDTGTYLKSLDDPPHVKVIWLPHSGKPAVVRNAALRESQGEYVAFLDSDDLWLPKKLEIQIASLRGHANRQWSYTRFALVDESGNPAVSARTRNWPAPSGWILEKLLQGDTVIALPSVVVSRRLLGQLGAFDEELVMCEDDELWFRLAAHSEIDGIEDPLTLIRRHGRHSGDDIIAWQDRRRVFEKALRTGHSDHLDPLLRKLRAEMSAGLAKSQAAAGRRSDAVGTLFSSVSHSWRYPRCWLSALAATAFAFAPQEVRSRVRRYRQRRRALLGL